MLNEHLWALVLQHLDTLRARVKASTSCRAAWNAGLLKLNIPVHMPREGTSHLPGSVWLAHAHDNQNAHTPLAP